MFFLTKNKQSKKNKIKKTQKKNKKNIALFLIFRYNLIMIGGHDEWIQVILKI